MDSHATFGRTCNGLGCIDANNIFDLGLHTLRLCLREIHLIQYRNHLKSLLNRGVAIGNGLGFNPLCRVYHQQGTLTGVQRSRHLITEINMTGRVDEVQFIHLPIIGLVLQGHALRFNRDPTFALDVH
jgi:hypothetical protein